LFTDWNSYGVRRRVDGCRAPVEANALIADDIAELRGCTLKGAGRNDHAFGFGAVVEQNQWRLLRVVILAHIGEHAVDSAT
jgi:hypothetical protein